MQMKFFVDNYSSGRPRDITGPFETPQAARATCDTSVEVYVDPCDGVIEELEEEGGSASLIEAWSSAWDSEDYQAIYSVQ